MPSHIIALIQVMNMNLRNALKKWCENPSNDLLNEIAQNINQETIRWKALSKKLIFQFYHILKKVFSREQIMQANSSSLNILKYIFENVFVVIEDIFILMGSYYHCFDWFTVSKLEYNMLYITKKGHNSIQELMQIWHWGKCLLHTKYVKFYRPSGKFNLKELKLLFQVGKNDIHYIRPTDVYAIEYLCTRMNDTLIYTYCFVKPLGIIIAARENIPIPQIPFIMSASINTRLKMNYEILFIYVISYLNYHIHSFIFR